MSAANPRKVEIPVVLMGFARLQDKTVHPILVFQDGQQQFQTFSLARSELTDPSSGMAATTMCDNASRSIIGMDLRFSEGVMSRQ